jgi:hypothetical protein
VALTSSNRKHADVRVYRQGLAVRDDTFPATRPFAFSPAAPAVGAGLDRFSDMLSAEPVEVGARAPTTQDNYLDGIKERFERQYSESNLEGIKLQIFDPFRFTVPTDQKVILILLNEVICVI